MDTTGEDAYWDRLYDEANPELGECPECHYLSLSSEGGADRKGQWVRVECCNSECDYGYSDVEIYDEVW